MQGNLTRQQVLFYKGLKRIRYIDECIKNNPERDWTAEKQEREKIVVTLCNSVINFGLKEAHKMMDRYQLGNDAYSDIYQSLYVKIVEKLYDYDPLRATPTTFYVKYFHEVITDYLANEMHMSKYNNKNMRLISKVVQEYEEKGIRWTPDMVSTRTGLSEKIIMNTLKAKENSNYLAIDDDAAVQFAANTPTPEESFIAGENSICLYERMKELLTPDEFEVVVRRIIPDSPSCNRAKLVSCEQVARDMDLQPKDIKRIYNRAMVKMERDKELRRQFPNMKRAYKKPSAIVLQDNASDILQGQILDALSGESRDVNDMVEPGSGNA